jgi:hypothetical protein
MHKPRRRKHANARLKCEFCPRYFRNTTGLAIHRNSIHIRPAQSIVEPDIPSDNDEVEDERPDDDPSMDFFSGSQDSGEDFNSRGAAANRREFHPILDGKVLHVH